MVQNKIEVVKIPEPRVMMPPVKQPKVKIPKVRRLNIGELRAILSRSAPRRIVNDLRIISQGEQSIAFRRLVRKPIKEKIKKLRAKGRFKL